MAFESNYVTMIGNLTDDPELRFTQGGAAVVNFRIASNRRYKDRSGQDQEETTFMAVNAWRDLAENAAESLKKGDRAVVIGRIKVRSYEANDGSGTRWVTEIEADEICPSLRWAKAVVTRNSGGGSGSGGGGGGAKSAPPAPTDEDVPF
jgi:single-strand DNA-binding protein